MFQRALFLASVIAFALLLYLAQALSFLAPYRVLLWKEYRSVIAAAFLVLLANLTAGLYLVLRGLTLARAGRRLAHVEHELLQEGHIHTELAQRLARE
ncbi:MAG: hypothetical protein GEU99_23460 [Luteitalea sp.]|nr:hypothetical protein [Luteitalea sp.]